MPARRIEAGINTVNGSGCPAGTAAVAAAPDNTAFTVTYSDYLAQVGGEVSLIESRKNCQLNLNVHVPQGFTYAVAAVDYRGYGYLTPAPAPAPAPRRTRSTSSRARPTPTRAATASR